MKRRKKRGVYFVNRPAPTERAWLLAHGATEEDLGFPDPKTDPLAGLFPDPALRDRFAFLLKRLGEASGRALLFDEARGVPFRAFLGVGPPDREGDHPEGLILLRGPDPRARLPGLADDAPGARYLVSFYRGGLGGLCGGGDLIGLALPGEVHAWSKARKHDLAQIDFLPEHRTRNLRIFWDHGDGTEAVFDATGRVYEFRGGERLDFRFETVQRYLEEGALRIAAGRAEAQSEPAAEPPAADAGAAGDWGAVAPGHPLAEARRLRAADPESLEPADLRAGVRSLEAGGLSRDELADLHLSALAREGRWDEYASELRRLINSPVRSLIDRPRYWRWLQKAGEARARPGEFREAALASAAGPLATESRGAICDILIDTGNLDAAVTLLERWMRPGQPPHPELTQRLDRLRALRPGRR